MEIYNPTTGLLNVNTVWLTVACSYCRAPAGTACTSKRLTTHSARINLGLKTNGWLLK